MKNVIARTCACFQLVRLEQLLFTSMCIIDLNKTTITAFEKIHLNIKTTCVFNLSFTILTMTKTMVVYVVYLYDIREVTVCV